MIDVFLRALQHPIDYHHALKKRTIVFREKILDPAGSWSFLFEPTTDITWKAGQHAVFSFTGMPIRRNDWRPFSIASAPAEKIIHIGTQIPDPHSTFKERLLHLAPGDTMSMFGPFGEFHTHEGQKKIIGVAGGIGITPFRSIACEIGQQQSDTELHLVYAARDQYPYREKLDTWSKTSEKLHIMYVHTPEEVNAALDGLIEAHGTTTPCYVSGAPRMIEAIITHCREKGVSKITNDPFKGY